MTTIHAVIYVSGNRGFIARGGWKDAQARQGVTELVHIPAPASAEDEVLNQLEAFARERAEGGTADSHEVVASEGQTGRPHLLIFGFDGRNWVARGFQTWGGATVMRDAADGAPTSRDPWVLVLASHSTDPESDEYIWRQAVTNILFVLRNDGDGLFAADQSILELVPLEDAEGSVAFLDSDAIAGETGSANAADFGNAADSGD